MSSFPDRGGLQPERTALAWQRTAITSLVVLVPVVLVSLRIEQPLVAGLGAGAALVSCALVVSVRRRFGELHDDEVAFSPFSPMVQVAVVTVLAAAGGVLVGVLSFLR